jgi:hypothetical protein
MWILFSDFMSEAEYNVYRDVKGMHFVEINEGKNREKKKFFRREVFSGPLQ